MAGPSNPPTVASAPVLSFRNRIINGAFAVNQRGTGTVSTTYAAGAFVRDRWKAGPGGCTMSSAVQPNGDVAVTITAGTLVQVIEGGLYVLEGGSYVLSWQGTATARVYQDTASGAYAASSVSVSGLTAGGDTTVEFGPGTLSLAQFEPGTTATTFERRDDELSRCQRYFAFANINYRFNYAGSGYSEQLLQFPKTMRANPSIVLFTIGIHTNAGTGVVYGVTPAKANVYYQVSAAGDTYVLNEVFSASAEL